MRRAGRVFIIAEAGVNHNGSLDQALRLIDVAADAGADAVKFQTFKAAELASSDAKQAEYQRRNTQKSESQLEMLRRLELSREEHYRLAEHCKARDIAFMSTAFDLSSLDLVMELNPQVLKIPSGDVTASPLVLETARRQLPIILSTGMCTLADIERALGVIAFGYLNNEEQPSPAAFLKAFAEERGQKLLQERVTLLHCTTNYPAQFPEVNLRALDTLAAAFNLPIGYSDHTLGTAISIAAVARGASMIEKHFTLDRSLPGPDHKASLEPEELARMVADIRNVEQALGDGRKVPGAAETANIPVARRSLIARNAIPAGQLFTADDVAVQRPGDGLDPHLYWDLLGRRAIRSFQPGERIEW